MGTEKGTTPNTGRIICLLYFAWLHFNFLLPPFFSSPFFKLSWQWNAVWISHNLTENWTVHCKQGHKAKRLHLRAEIIGLGNTDPVPQFNSVSESLRQFPQFLICYCPLLFSSEVLTTEIGFPNTQCFSAISCYQRKLDKAFQRFNIE